MTVHLTHHATADGQVVLRATGELDAVQTPALARAVDTLVKAGAHRLVLDFTDLTFIDSSALGALVLRLRVLRQRGGDMVVAASTPSIVRPITASGTDAVLAVVPSVADAQGVTELQGARSRRHAHGHGGSPRTAASRPVASRPAVARTPRPSSRKAS